MRIGLGILQVFIGLSGVAGGLGLLSDPTGSNVGMSAAWLADSPFSDFLVPGVVLLSVNGLGNLIGGILTFAGQRRYGEIGASLGLFLTAWVVAQVWWIGLFHWLQPLYFCLGVAELVLGIMGTAAMRDGSSRARHTEV